jgi:hypothetical protein
MTARERWNFCPQDLKEMFIRAFTDGLSEPDRRITEGEWQNLFSEIKDRITSCPRCHAENFLNTDGIPGTCWHCHTPIPMPPFLVIRRPPGYIHLALSNGTTLRRRHISLSAANDDGSAIIGIVVPHPTIPGASGIRNISTGSWDAAFPDGTRITVPQGRAVPLNPGTVITIDGVVLTITATDFMVNS